MKIISEIIGIFIISLFLIAIPILCTLSFVYNWFPGAKFILLVTCIFEWFGLINLLGKISDEQDKK